MLRSILRAAHAHPVLLSVHSVGRTREVVALLTEQPHPGAILHWFLGEPALINAANEAGCYFSVNAAMPDDVLLHIPRDRMLPETDFPFSRRQTRARIPGDIAYLELRISQLTGLSLERVRWQWYKNLRAISVAAGVLDRLPDALADPPRLSIEEQLQHACHETLSSAACLLGYAARPREREGPPATLLPSDGGSVCPI